MIWILFVILVNGEQYMVKPESMHPSMDSCFERREEIVTEVGKPIVNYQVICVPTDQGTL